MMRVGTQRRSKSSNNSPNATYRQSPTSSNRLNTPSPINHISHLNSSYNSSNKNSSYSNNKYRETPSPNFNNSSHKYTQDYQRLTVNENRLSSNSPSFDDRLRATSPGPIPRISSPSLAPRAQSPSYRAQSPEYISSKRLNERRYETSSPSFTKNVDYDSSFTNKMSSLRVTGSQSPNFVERKSPSPGYVSNSRYERKATETKTYNSNSYDETDLGVDTTPIIKVSGVNDGSSARRDSWDAIAKTRNILSHRSLESVANLADRQLDKNYEQREIEENERLMKREQIYSTQSYSQNYSTSQNYGTTTEKSYDNSYNRTNDNKVGGASAIKVQPVPDGVLGQPVEFESM